MMRVEKQSDFCFDVWTPLSIYHYFAVKINDSKVLMHEQSYSTLNMSALQVVK